MRAACAVLSAVVVMLAYLLATWALLVAADPKQGGNLAALLIPIHATMGPIVSDVIAEADIR